MMTTLNETKDYISTKFAPDISASELPDDIDLVATGIITSVSTVQLLGWCGRTYGIPINSLPINPEALKTPADIAEFIEAHRTISTQKEEHVDVH